MILCGGQRLQLGARRPLKAFYDVRIMLYMEVPRPQRWTRQQVLSSSSLSLENLSTGESEARAKERGSWWNRSSSGGCRLLIMPDN